MKETNLRKTKGITLIALVITIIVLLILAGVAISMLSGENGILRKAADAKTKTEEGQKQEETALTSMELETHFRTTNSKYKCSNGYITGITVKGDSVVDKVQDLQNALPDGYVVKAKDETENFTYKDKNDQPIVTTGLAIQKDNKTVARTVIFGDINDDGKFSISDEGDIVSILTQQSLENIEEYEIMAADADHNGIVNLKDSEIIRKNWDGKLETSEVIVQDKYVSKIEDLIADTAYVIENKYRKLFNDRLEGSKYRIEFNNEFDVYLLNGTSEEMTVGEVLEILGNEENIVISNSTNEKKDEDKLEEQDTIEYKHSDGRKTKICEAL